MGSCKSTSISSLGFVELEMKVEGLLDAFTNLQNPNFDHVPQAIGFHAARLERAEELEAAVRDVLNRGARRL